MSVAELRNATNCILVAGLAGGTNGNDEVIFSHFVSFHLRMYHFDCSILVDRFNSDMCRRHRSECVSGYIATLSDSDARFKTPALVSAALRRSFELRGLSTDVFGKGTVVGRVISALGTRALSFPQAEKLAVTDTMLMAARASAFLPGRDRSSMQERMLGLASLVCYVFGLRVGELAATRSPSTKFDPLTQMLSKGVEANKHTLLVRLVWGAVVQLGEYAPGRWGIRIDPGSTKTTRAGASKPSARCKVHVAWDNPSYINKRGRST